MSDPARAPHPRLGAALGYALLAWILIGWTGAAVHAAGGSPALARGVGLVLGLGGAGALAALRIPAPHGDRVGLHPLRRPALAGVVLLAPAVVLGSALDGALEGLLPPEQAEALQARREAPIASPEPAARVETLVLGCGLAPVLEEWFFRGLLQQGLVGQLGGTAGVLATAALFALVHGDPTLSLGAGAVVVTVVFAYGLLLGIARLWSGSLLGAVVLHALLNGVQVASAYARTALPVPGLSAPGSTASVALLGGAAGCVGTGLWLLWRSRPAGSAVP